MTINVFILQNVKTIHVQFLYISTFLLKKTNILLILCICCFFKLRLGASRSRSSVGRSTKRNFKTRFKTKYQNEISKRNFKTRFKSKYQNEISKRNFQTIFQTKFLSSGVWIFRWSPAAELPNKLDRKLEADNRSSVHLTAEDLWRTC